MSAWMKGDKKTIKISMDFPYITSRYQAVKITQIPEE